MSRRLIPIYTSDGDCLAYMGYPYIYDTHGEWIAFATSDRNVYSIVGEYIGNITDDPRIIRAISSDGLKSRVEPPPAPPKIVIKVDMALAPMMPDLPNNYIDVLQDEPHKFLGNR